MKVTLSPRARADLREIGFYIAQDNPKRARSFVAELFTAAHELATSAHLYPVLDRYRDLQIRRRVYRDYLILFRTTDQSLAVLRIVHGARDYQSLL
ncbi:MAG: hypothetical protein JWM33_2338 [Caulobacteraceae bacterium]|nr:hypothetical protein [Caulobacteraceae bacterium]